MSLFNNRALTLLTLLLALLFLSISTTTAAPTPADTAASTFIVNIYSSRGDCNSHYLTDVGEGPYVKGGGACFQYGGNAFWLTQSGGCKAQSWSGNNCRGSSSKLTNDGFCHPVPFGSILVVC